MKKYLSMVLMICVVFTSLVIPTAVMADVNVAVSESFEDSGNLLFAEAAGITVPTDNAYGINKYISFESGTYRGLKTENIIPVGDNDTTFRNIGANAYAEYEFDMKPSGQAQFSFGQYNGDNEGTGNDHNMFTLIVDAYGNMTLTARKQKADTDGSGNTTSVDDFLPFLFEGDLKTADSTNESGLIGRDEVVLNVGRASADEWNRIKIVTRVTNNNNAAVTQIKQVYINGNPQINDSETYFFRQWTMHRVTRFDQVELTVQNGTFGLDNFTASVYNSADGISPIAEQGYMLYALRNKYRYSEGFEGDTNSLFNVSEGITTQNEDVYGIGKYIDFAGAAESAIYTGEAFTNPIPMSSSNTDFSKLGANAYAEIEFDVKSNGDDSIRFGDNESNNMFEMRFDGGGNLTITAREKTGDKLFEDFETGDTDSVAKSDVNLSLGAYTPKEWHRIKIVTRLTSKNGAQTTQIKQVYVDGEARITGTSEYFFRQYYAGRASSLNKIIVRSGWEEKSISLDNFNTYFYNSPDGTSPFEDNSKLISALRYVQRNDAVRGAKAIAAAIEVLENADAVQSDYETAYTNLKPFVDGTAVAEGITFVESKDNLEGIEGIPYNETFGVLVGTYSEEAGQEISLVQVGYDYDGILKSAKVYPLTVPDEFNYTIIQEVSVADCDGDKFVYYLWDGNQAPLYDEKSIER